tara:strand:+ start:43208 stop:44443 length:1236 start_codon:yes stop_codon:yes gene_type:complete
MKLEIHQVAVGNPVLTGDNGSVQMIWNNITGVNFDNGNDYTEWMNYINNVVLPEILPTSQKIILVQDGIAIDEDDRLDMYRRPLLKGINNLEDIAVYEDGKVKELKGEAKELLIKRAYTRDYYFNLHKMDDRGSRLVASYRNIIGSVVVGYVENSSIPKYEPKVVLVKSNPIETAIKGCTVEDNLIRLPDGQLDPKTFKEVKKQLENIGGKWNTSAQGFKFDVEPTDLLNKLKGGDKINLKQDFQFFETPDELIKEMISKANIQPTDTVLEPSAGKGAIVKHLTPLAKKVDMCEFMPSNKAYLEQVLNYDVIGSDFLALDIRLKYNKIVANPPFSKNQDITHVMKMYDHLKEGGKLVAITSTSWVTGNQKKQVEFRSFLDSIGAIQTLVEKGTFKNTGTNVASMMLELVKK